MLTKKSLIIGFLYTPFFTLPSHLYTDNIISRSIFKIPLILHPHDTTSSYKYPKPNIPPTSPRGGNSTLNFNSTGGGAPNRRHDLCSSRSKNPTNKSCGLMRLMCAGLRIARAVVSSSHLLCVQTVPRSTAN